MSRATKRSNAISLTAMRLPAMRPNSSSATSCWRWEPRHSSSCADADPATPQTMRATIAVRRPRIGRGRSAADPLDGRAAGGELVLQPLEAAVEMVDPIDHGLAFGGKGGDHQRHRGAQIGGHHRRALEPLDSGDGGALAVELDARAEPCQLLHVHEAVLE